MVFYIGYSVSTDFETLPKTTNGSVRIERWTNVLKIFSVVMFKLDLYYIDKLHPLL
jgi:hypothetical protein